MFFFILQGVGNSKLQVKTPETLRWGCYKFHEPHIEQPFGWPTKPNRSMWLSLFLSFNYINLNKTDKLKVTSTDLLMFTMNIPTFFSRPLIAQDQFYPLRKITNERHLWDAKCSPINTGMTASMRQKMRKKNKRIIMGSHLLLKTKTSIRTTPTCSSATLETEPKKKMSTKGRPPVDLPVARKEKSTKKRKILPTVVGLLFDQRLPNPTRVGKRSLHQEPRNRLNPWNF